MQPSGDLVKERQQAEAYVQALTDLLRTLEAGATVTQSEIVATVADLATVGRPDQLSEMDSLRLQLMLDRRSKLEQTLSNILKKIEDTTESITQNLK